ncbi:hypothetical protein K461DRAFT_22045 [Myriangium duriaei CBS 260.36]|uniref:Uncharacterized protein n=1 Tax=Myriangium duriaei CBS 260.36 TaxID=1168546 RepID=A0A9P4MLU1_9PEZI|nr:hypothetical protein K461DRAFT_22045 [Myriangium duriaei CBS 260.36]
MMASLDQQEARPPCNCRRRSDVAGHQRRPGVRWTSALGRRWTRCTGPRFSWEAMDAREVSAGRCSKSSGCTHIGTAALGRVRRSRGLPSGCVPEGLVGKTSAEILTESVGFRDSHFTFAGARGAALYARWRQEAPIGCRERPQCERKRERGRRTLEVHRGDEF